MRRALVLVGLLLAACSGNDDDADAGGPPTTPPPVTRSPTASSPTSATAPAPASATTVPLDDVAVRLTEIARVASPTAMAVRRGDDRLYVTEQAGRVVRVPAGGGAKQTVVDVRDDVSAGGERGLLGLAFSPDGATMYLDYTNTDGDTHVDAVAVAADGTAGARRTLLVVEQPYPNHNGGQLVVRPDGTLWIGLGDGGSGGDPHDNGQRLDTLLGKILRIDPTRPDGDRLYSIPDDNPFVGRGGARPEIWAYGLRNPWRFSFDRDTGDLWIADVGQNAWEEVNLEPAGGSGGRNYGWNRREGAHPFEGRAPANAVDPIVEYSHDDGGVTVIGGYVYRGSRVPALRGAYLYADYADGELRAVRQRGGRVVDSASLGVDASPLSSFGEDAAGELYVLSLSGRLYRVDPA